MKPKTIQELCEERYADADIIAALIEDADRNDTTERIESGELSLPHPQDAQLWYDRRKAEEDAAKAKADKSTKRGGK